ncbi:peptidase [Vibrio sp. UCD-FRSSP16_10]|uniref:ATP-dependent zinc protease family protein n=1 Tax=unclassified Vibrio TaxID=2614977 RepID=UPI0008008FB5|nr:MULTISPECIES: RimK/LysX family protein [unclassified Vibrio]OBT10117.1 peptidase [Vibrio sp. UCD-FRSSP16_30]OBT18907.1 peptidase [Vibrio sp. UCD-FRSSP16_10]
MKKIIKPLSLLMASLASLPILADEKASPIMMKDSKHAYTTAEPALKWQDKVILGRIENVYYQDIESLNQQAFIGKIDTGADTTSMHAENIHVYSNNPKYKGLQDIELMQTIVDEFGGSKSNWWLESFDTPERNIQGIVKFDIRHPISGEVIQQERPLARTSVIRSRTSEIPLYRPVINIPLQIAGVTVNTDVNLTDRSNFSAPILIGKTFLKQNAWVFAGYDYLQSQNDARIVGRSEEFFVNGISLKTSFSLDNNYSQIHALNIKVSKDKSTVTFDTANKKGEQTTLTLPLERMLRVGGEKRPLVFIPAKAGTFEQPILAYLKDRSKLSSQLRLGKNTLSKYFIIDTYDKNILRSEDITFAQKIEKRNPLVVTTHEIIYFDNTPVNAEPSFSINTPVLFVDGFELSKGKHGEQVSFYIPASNGQDKKVIKKVDRKIRIGETVRPVLNEQVVIGGKKITLEFALEATRKNEKPYFAIGRAFQKEGVLINTRTEDLLDPRPLFHAGHIEKAKVEGLNIPVKLDTGADISSINALNIQRFDKDNKPMVTFDYKNADGLQKTFTKEVVDIMRIRAKAGEKPNERPVVIMNVQLGEVNKPVRVNLQDRSRFEYSMILGKNFLKNGVVVSSDDTYLLGK